VKHVAWLNVTPDKHDKSRRDSRIEGSPETELPFLTQYEQTLVSYWIEAGQVTSLGTGLAPLTWAEIQAWAKQFYTEQYVEWVEPPRPLRADGQPDERFRARPIPLLATQCVLTDWELQMIKRMSQEYVAEYSQNDPSRPCPKEVILDDITEDDKLANANAFESAFKSLFGADKVPAVEAVNNI
jgi:hypothetical protein